MPEASYRLTPDGDFYIENYNQARSFAGFLPGIAGAHGKPLWAFYVNRGQGIAGFGARDKDGAIMEFQPAAKAYALVHTHGFRTFLRANGAFCEPFAARAGGGLQVMTVRPHELIVTDEDCLGLVCEALFFTLPGERLPALVRRLTLSNRSGRELTLQIRDGLPVLVPANIRDASWKGVAHTKQATVVLEGLDKALIYARSTVKSSDAVVLERTPAGNFYFGLVSRGERQYEPAPVLADPERLFGACGSLTVPLPFVSGEKTGLTEQRDRNFLPCAFACPDMVLPPGEAVALWSIYGRVEELGAALDLRSRCLEPGFLEGKREENRLLTADIMDGMLAATSLPAFDLFCRQTYLDNTLRGGLPSKIGGRTFHLYFRKHGDLERDYNWFVLEPSYYSQGNANFRDICQNRRLDVYFQPDTGEDVLRCFWNALQMDGNNPLVYEGTGFRMLPDADLSGIFQDDRARNQFLAAFPGFFTPGEAAAWAEDHAGDLLAEPRLFPDAVIAGSERRECFRAERGYWADHWIYCLDLLESYAGVFPDRLQALFFAEKEFVWFDNPEIQSPCEARYILEPAGSRVRIPAATTIDGQKESLIAARETDATVARAGHGRGGIYRSSLAEKLLALICTRFSLLDPEGIGLEMLGDKPGWNDALNGLPSLLGSSLCETAELVRAIRLLARQLTGRKSPVALGAELAAFLAALAPVASAAAAAGAVDMREQLQAAREAYLAAIDPGPAGDKIEAEPSSILAFLAAAEIVLDAGIKAAHDRETGLFHAFAYHEVTGCTPVPDAKGETRRVDGMPLVSPERFRRVELPMFLEGQTRVMRVLRTREEASALHASVRRGPLFDAPLGMYKLNAPLAGVDPAVGRATLFTPGWLENESIWTHMELKYVLGLLQAGLYEEFFAELQAILPPFLDPAVYGRSPLEFSSFIVSSAYPDAREWGRGHYSRFTGATIEFMEIWLRLLGLVQAFVLDAEDKLAFAPRPVLPGRFFRPAPSSLVYRDGGRERWVELPADALAWRALGGTLFVYHNPGRLDTYGHQAATVVSFRLFPRGGGMHTHNGGSLPEELTITLRDSLVERVEMEIGSPGGRI